MAVLGSPNPIKQKRQYVEVEFANVHDCSICDSEPQFCCHCVIRHAVFIFLQLWLSPIENWRQI